MIKGVAHYLQHKGKTSQKRVIVMADTQRKEHGVDLKIKLENEQKRGNLYLIEAKGISALTAEKCSLPGIQISAGLFLRLFCV